jgi:hypothetical protein
LAANDRICPSCGAAAAGRFCGECGASLADAQVHVRQALKAEAVDALGLDRRSAATLRDLLLAPGRIVGAWMRGDRRTYLPPLRLFFALGGVYMLCLSVVQPYSFGADSLRSMGVPQETAARAEARIIEKGMTVELFNERFQSRMNTVMPVVTGLALLPLVVVLRVLDRRHSWAEHLAFMIGSSNGLWVVSLLLLPIALASAALHQAVLVLAMYLYLGWVFFAVYHAGRRLVTAGRFAVLAAIDLFFTMVLSVVLIVLMYGSVLLF